VASVIPIPVADEHKRGEREMTIDVPLRRTP
jgi:hypothetical protein